MDITKYRPPRTWLPRLASRKKLFDVDDWFEDFDKSFHNMFDQDLERYFNKEGDMIMVIAVPGYNESNLTVEILNDILTIKGKREVADDEVIVGSKEILRRFSIAPHVEVDASLKDGILTLKFTPPKAEAKGEAKKVELNKA